uniref:Uncharacterized protein n=1 Tax=Panagrellus redivivus TaxID=6233 RepID=A0A7E4VIW3_PANRE
MTTIESNDQNFKLRRNVDYRDRRLQQHVQTERRSQNMNANRTRTEKPSRNSTTKSKLKFAQVPSNQLNQQKGELTPTQNEPKEHVSMKKTKKPTTVTLQKQILRRNTMNTTTT